MSRIPCRKCNKCGFYHDFTVTVCGECGKDNMRDVAAIISEIDSQNGTLKAALGDDYEAIARSVRAMTAELQNAHSELNVIINDMNEYMARVHQARVSLD